MVERGLLSKRDTASRCSSDLFGGRTSDNASVCEVA